MNIFITRILLTITFIIGCILFSCSEDQTLIYVLGCFTTFTVLCGICYLRMRNNTIEVNNNILGITWLEKKTGLKFSEE